MKKFITDFGESIPATNAETGELICMINQYAVWGDMGRGKPEVIESSNDLDYLLKKYKLTKNEVVPNYIKNRQKY